MIVGMTHNEDGILNNITKYRGKISTGYEPNEAPNNENRPKPCGFYRMMKEVIKNQRVGVSQEIISVKDWILNVDVQKELEKINNGSVQPKRIEICCLVKNPTEMWESFMAKYSKSQGLLCKSHGKGTVAKYLVLGPNGERTWEERFKNEGGCPFDQCPDYKEGNCKQMGLMKCYPTIDLNPNPYRFETRSINTIVGFESSFMNLETLLKAAHMVKQIEAGAVLPYDGFFGSKLFLVHRKVKSGGRDVFISDLLPTPEFTQSVMEPIKRGLAARSKQAKIAGIAGNISLLGTASEQMLEASKAAMIEDFSTSESPVPTTLEDEQEIAVQFNSDAGDIDSSEVIENKENKANVNDVINKQAAELLLKDNKKE